MQGTDSMPAGTQPDGADNGVRAAIPALILATLAHFADGYDLGVMGFVVPELVKTWHRAPADLVPVLTAGVLGLLVGAPLLGYVGSRVSRKSALVACLVVVGVFSLLGMLSDSLGSLVVLRFLTGVGLGGLSPIVLALAAEIAPRRFRGLFMVIVLFGVPAGLVLPGWTAALLVPRFGWTALLAVGGIMPLLVAALSFRLLRGPQALPARRAGAPGPAARPRSSLRTLFAGRFAVITPMFWLLFAANQFTNFFILGWLPTLLQSAGLSTAQAGVDASLYSLGGIAGGLVLTVVIDRLGSIPVLVLFLLGAPAALSVGFVDTSTALLGVAVAACGFCVTGNNFATNAVLGMTYPGDTRPLGSGLAQASGRLGALAAQSAGGWLLARHASMQELYAMPAVALLAGAAATLVLTLAHRRRVAGEGDPAARQADGLTAPL